METSADHDEDDAASILTVLPSYSAANSTEPRRPDSPTPSYHTLDPSSAPLSEPSISRVNSYSTYATVIPTERLRESRQPLIGLHDAVKRVNSYRTYATVIPAERLREARQPLIGLHDAVKRKNLATVQAILEDNDQAIRISKSELESALHEAIKRGDQAILSALVGFARRLPSSNVSPISLLELAIRSNCKNSLLWVLYNDFDRGAHDECNRTALHVAAKYRHPNVKWVLLMCSRELVESRDKNGQTALHYASKYGEDQNIAILVEHGADVNAVDGKGCTPLHYAAKMLRSSHVRQLILKGAEVNRIDTSGYTPLNSAIQGAIENHTSRAQPRDRERSPGEERKTLQILLDAATPEIVNTPTSRGETALHLAVTLGDMKLIDKLLRLHASAQAKTLSGQTPLHYVVQLVPREDAVWIARNLLEAGAEGDARDNQNNSALDLLVIRFQEEFKMKLEMYESIHWKNLTRVLQKAGAGCTRAWFLGSLEANIALNATLLARENGPLGPYQGARV